MDTGQQPTRHDAATGDSTLNDSSSTTIGQATEQAPAGSRLARIDPGEYALTTATLSRLMTPALVIYAGKVRRNIARMIQYMGGDPERWRPHLKTTKTPEIYAMLVDAGVRNFKCATVREAECLLEVVASRGVTGADLLIAYPIQGPAMQRAAALASAAANNSGAAVSVLSEDPAHARGVPEPLGIFVDVNPGMNRTGVPVTQDARVMAVAGAAGTRFRGVHFYDGHIHHDSAAARRSAVHAIHTGLLALLARMRNNGLDCAEVITSGTPAFRYALDFPGFGDGTLADGPRHRVSPGTVVFHDFQYDDLLEDLELEPAAVVVARVVSHPAENIATCDAGSKSIAAECGNPVGFAIGRADLQAQSPSEEHLPMAVLDSERGLPALGTVLYLVPRHVCPTVNLAEQALLVEENGDVRAVRVAARAHELLLPSADTGRDGGAP